MQKSVLFLTVNPPKPSTKQRILDSLEYLRERGMSCTVMPVPDHLAGRLGMFAMLAGYDAVCIQKKLMSPLEIRLMRLINPRLVYDVDDAVLFHEVERGEPLDGKYFKRFLTMVGCARAVMVGNRFLYGFARYNNDNVQIVPTPINVSRYTPKDYASHGDAVVVGWMGTPGNLRYLKGLGDALREVAARHPNMRLKIISGRFIDIEGVETIKKKWSQDEELEDLRSLDIGLMPLSDDIWAMGKSGNKILQYFGVAVPAVASPVGTNSDIIKPGVNGFLAGTTEEWVEHISHLIQDSDKRMEMGLRGREDVLKHYSQEAHMARLHAVLDSVLNGA